MGLTDKNLFAYCDNNPITRKDNGGQFWDTVFDVVSLGISIIDVINDPTDVGNWVGLVGDAVDLIPFVTGVGEVTRAVNLSRKALGAVDDAHDAAKVIDRTGDALETGWKVGDDITKVTKAGNRSSWTTVRQRYWKNEEFFNGSKHSQEMRDLMKKVVHQLWMDAQWNCTIQMDAKEIIFGFFTR